MFRGRIKTQTRDKNVRNAGRLTRSRRYRERRRGKKKNIYIFVLLWRVLENRLYCNRTFLSVCDIFLSGRKKPSAHRMIIHSNRIKPKCIWNIFHVVGNEYILCQNMSYFRLFFDFQGWALLYLNETSRVVGNRSILSGECREKKMIVNISMEKRHTYSVEPKSNFIRITHATKSPGPSAWTAQFFWNSPRFRLVLFIFAV